VEACPPSTGYRLRKYVRRNRRGLVPLTGFVLVLAVATGGSTWQAVRAHDAQLQAEADRDRATTAESQAKIAENRAANEAAMARAVNEFLQQDLLGQAGSLPRFGQDVGRNSDLTVHEALDRAASRIGERFLNQPLTEAAVRMAIGEAYNNLSAFQ